MQILDPARLLVASFFFVAGLFALAPVAEAVLPPSHLEAVDAAQSCLGTPYLAGGATLDGFDEPGLVAFVYVQLGIALPRSISELRASGHEVSKDGLKPGDVVIWTGTDGIECSGIYVGSPGWMITASRDSGLVKYASISDLVVTGRRRVGSFTGRQAAARARSLLGLPYRSGGSSRAGFDAPGLSRYVYQALGVWLPADVSMQSTLGRRVSPDHLRRGDLVFWDSRTTGAIQRVGIYCGRHRVVLASRQSGQVRERDLRGIVLARRLLPIL